jgi:predicted PurR-regulated permease PerM
MSSAERATPAQPADAAGSFGPRGEAGREPPRAAGLSDQPTGDGHSPSKEDEAAKSSLLPSGVTIDIRSFMLTGLFVIAAVAGLYFARPVFLPVVLAVLLSFLLTPIVTLLGSLRIPAPVASGIVIALLIAAVVGGTFQLIPAATEWMDALPAQMERVEEKLHSLRGPLESVERATEQVEEIATGEDAQPPAPDEPVQVEIQKASLTDVIIAELRGAGVMLILVVTLLYFLLASGDRFLQKLVKVQTKFEDKKRAVEIVRQVKSDVSTYLLTITLINAGLGVVTGFAMYFLGMPNPLLWGVMAAVLNFIPYVGALVGAAVLGLAAAVQFDEVGRIMAVPGVFLILTTLEGYIVTPLVLGARLTLSPVVIFIGLIFWSWLWGIPGALIAVPMLVMAKIICDRIEPLKPVGEFLGQ